MQMPYGDGSYLFRAARPPFIDGDWWRALTDKSTKRR
jgi:hypothetical protein